MITYSTVSCVVPWQRVALTYVERFAQSRSSRLVEQGTTAIARVIVIDRAGSLGKERKSQGK